MLRPGNDVQVYLYAEAVVDMRKSIDGLSALVERDMALPVNSDVLFVFCNRGRDKIKMLYWERNGFIVWYKRLEKQRFKWPKAADTLSLSGQELNWLLDGFDIFNNRPHQPLHCDETTVQVLNEQGKRAQSKSYMWVRVGGPPTQPIRLFHYADSRSGDVASHLLEGYEGYLQTDDYAGYNLACAKPAITQLGCWAHARRKFVEAQKVAAGATGKADLDIAMIAKLYAIEKRIQNSDPQERHAIRQQEAVPQLNQIRQWLDKALHRTLPKGALGKALAYLEKNWGKFTVYTEDGRLSIDNNPAENAIRPFVLGRKNWIFSASVDGAKASANLYGLIETAKANNLEPMVI